MHLDREIELLGLHRCEERLAAHGFIWNLFDGGIALELNQPIQARQAVNQLSRPGQANQGDLCLGKALPERHKGRRGAQQVAKKERAVDGDLAHRARPSLIHRLFQRLVLHHGCHG